MKAHHLAWAGCKWLARTVGTLALWTLWLALGILLAAQVYVACTNTLEVPAFAQRAIERRLALSGVRVTFGRTRFDPSGRILIEKVGVRLPGFEEEVVTARAIYARLDPWALAVGRFEPLELRVTGMSLRVPAMLSPSGHADEVVHDLDGDFLPRGDELGIEYLNFRLGDVGIAAQGGLHLRHHVEDQSKPLPLVEFLARNYAAFSREFADAIELFGVLDQPVVRVVLTPSVTHGGVAGVEVMARGLKLARPALQVAGLRASGEFPFPSPGDPPATTEFEFSADELKLSQGTTAHRVAGRLDVRLSPGRFRFEPGVFRKIECSAADLSVAGVTVQAPVIALASDALPRVRARVLALLFGAPLSIRADVDLDARSATARIAGLLSPGLIDPLGARLKRDLRKYVDLAEPMAVDGTAEFTAGWKFARASGRLAATGLTIRGVRIAGARGRVEFAGRRLAASALVVRFGENTVLGSYEENLATRDYRFLAAGRSEPLAISPWVLSWWTDLVGKFAFPGAAPGASVDARSCWGEPRKAAVFLAVQSDALAYRGVACDWLRGRLFIRPTLTDGLEFQVARGAGSARGSFAIARRYAPDGPAVLRRVDFDVVSTLDLAPFTPLAGPKVGPVLEPFVFVEPPSIKAEAHIDGPAEPAGGHRTLHVEVSSPGPFRYHDFPFQQVAFVVDENDDRIAIRKVDLGLAGGEVSGQAMVWGTGPAQRLNFSASLKGASLGQTITAVNAYTAVHNRRPAPPVSDFVRAKANVRLDLSAEAEGECKNLLSFKGTGSAKLQGPELGEVHMLGLLSELFKFTLLHFTTAQADFQIDGPRLIFPDVEITGANSGIKAQGTYGLDKHDLDFKAKVYPFGKSKSLPGELMSGVLNPLSQIFEVKLTGTVAKPSWSL